MPVDSGSSADNQWHELLPELGLSGMALQLADHCLLQELTDDKVTLALDNAGLTLQTERTEVALREALQTHFVRPLQLVINAVAQPGETPQQRRIRVGKELQLKAEQAIADDPFVQQLQKRWGGVVLPGSVRPTRDLS